MPDPLFLEDDRIQSLSDNPRKRTGIRKKVTKRKNSSQKMGGSSTSPNACIVCGKGFNSSADVQNHLLHDHINTSPSSGNNTKEKNKTEASVVEGKHEVKAYSNPNVFVEEFPLVEDAREIKIEHDTDNQMKVEDILVHNISDRDEDDMDEGDIEIDEEHYSINHVEVRIDEKDGGVALDEADYCPIIDENIYIIDEEDTSERPVDDSDENDSFQEIEDETDECKDQHHAVDELSSNPIIGDAMEIVGEIGKAPVYLKCEICEVILTSILNFTMHMKKMHKDSEQELNKPFSCETCGQGFYFLSSLNSHKSKAHKETSGNTFRCPLCPSVTNSKNGMRRHLRNSHKRTDLLNEELSYKCHHCSQLFWSIAERTTHIAETHEEASGSLEKCFICLHISPNRHALRRHFQRMHPNQPLFESVSFKCGDCGLLFPQRSLLRNHIKEVHPKAVTYQCAYCPQQLKNKKALGVHINQHKKNCSKGKEQGLSYTCNVCTKEFASKKALKTHFSSVHSDKARKGFICKVCNKVLDTSNDRSLHYKVEHPDSNPYLCSICGLGFITKSSLYNHRMCHKSQKAHKCTFCGKEFSRRDSFNEHVLIHNGPRHKCPHCPKEFVQKSNLKRHIRIHLGIKPYQCQFCEMTFSDKGACNSHQRTHTGEERSACPICNVMFSKKQKLKYHMRIHTGEGLETCTICSKVFTHSYALNVHMKTHNKENRFMCHECKMVFVNGSKLYLHLQTHGPVRVNCNDCGRNFRYSRLLNRHMLAVHQGVEGLRCTTEQCGVSSSRLVEIRDHVREAHSVKNPVIGTNFEDMVAKTENDEVDLAAIYEGLDTFIDSDVMASGGETIKVKVKGKRSKNQEEKEIEDECGSELEIKAEPLDD